MKIIRHLSPTGPAWAALQPDGSARAITGDLLSDFQVTGQEVKPGKLLAPLQPANLLCIGLNYKQHAAESNSPTPAHPVLFIKNTASVQNPGDPIELPVKLASTKVDYECELAIVIGRRCKNVSKAEALDYVLGYTCANDVTAMELIGRDPSFPQWARAKGMEGFGAFGPVIETDFDPASAALRTLVGGRERQNYPLADMFFSPAELVHRLSQDMVLEPGDVILCGTSLGVLPMKPGTRVEVVIDGIGTLANDYVKLP